MNQVIEKVENQITEFNEFESKLTEFKGQYDNVVYDLTDPHQDKKARSDRLTIGKVISSLDKKHKELKAPLKEKVDLIDGERKRIKDELLEAQGKIKSQIEEHERKIKEHQEMLAAKVQVIYDLAEFGEFERPTSADLEAKLTTVKSIVLDDSYETMKAEAALAITTATDKLEALHTATLKREDEQAELDRLRKEAEDRERKDREERIAREAAEKAKREAEEAAKAERDRLEREKREAEEAVVRAEQEKKAAAERAEAEKKAEAERAAKAERERIEKEQREAEAKAAAERQAEEKRKAKQNYRAKIHKEAQQGFMAAGFDEADAADAVTAIKDGLVTHVSINY